MKDLRDYLVTAALGVLAYFLVFGFVLDKPLTLRPVGDLVAFKRDAAMGMPSPKIAVLAGSNGRVSHSCAAMARALARPCVNLGTTAGLGLDYVFAEFEPALQAGDVVYMPLEYQQYFRTPLDLATGPDAALSFRHDKRKLLSRDARSILQAAFMFDLTFAIRAAGEMAFSAAGIRRPFDQVDHPGAKPGEKSLSPAGDEIGNTPERAQLYQPTLSAMKWTPVQPAEFEASDGGERAVRRFLKRACARKLIVVGGLPTTFADQPVPPATVDRIRRIFEGEGHSFVALPNLSQYPRTDFYDSAYHLTDEAQARHSLAVAGALKPFLKASAGGTCPAIAASPKS